MRAVSTMIVSAAETALAVATSPAQSAHFHTIHRPQVTTKLDSICTYLQLQFLRERERERERESIATSSIVTIPKQIQH